LVNSVRAGERRRDVDARQRPHVLLQQAAHPARLEALTAGMNRRAELGVWLALLGEQVVAPGAREGQARRRLG
jgi:hypothetical protein